jgi:hypothetical protein
MKTFHRIAGLTLAAALLAAPASAGAFLKAIADMPLMDGLTEQAEPVVFESDRGRIIRTSAEGKTDGSAVWKYYVETLPALGWAREGDTGKFRRGSEQLTVEVLRMAGDGRAPTIVNFELVVKLASSKLPE